MAIAVLGVAIYMAGAILVDFDRLASALRKLGMAGSLAILGLSLLNYVLRYVRWQHYLDRLAHHVPTGRHLLYYLSGFAFTVSPGKAGEAFRSLYLKPHGVSYTDSIAALFSERLLDLISITLIAGLIAVQQPAYRPLLAGVALIIAILVTLAGHSWMPATLRTLAQQRTGRIATLMERAAALFESASRLTNFSTLMYGLALGLVAWGAEALGLYLICDSLQISIGLVAAMGVYALAILAGSAAIFLPGGVGGSEVVMTALLMAYGAPLSAAVVATLLCRLATLWFAVILGLLAIAALETARMRYNKKSPAP